MEAVIKTPMDYQESLAFRRLAEWFCPATPDVVKASYVYSGVFRELAYLAREGNDPGRLSPADQSLVTNILTRVTDKVDELFKVLVDEGEKPIRLFIRDGADLICLPFGNHNRHLSATDQSKESRGGVMKHFKKDVERAENPNYQLMLGIAAEKLVDEAGAQLDALMTQQVKWFVVVMDSALGKPDRGGHDFSRELVQNAVINLKKHTKEVANAVAHHIARNRTHPAFRQKRTEQLMIPAEFDALVALLPKKS